MSRTKIGEVACTVIEAYHVSVPRYELWFAPEHVLAVWETLQAAGANPCGLEATEALRVLEAIPLYGVDLNDRDLPQETAQTRALNFSKGCYLGQEIVERIRSRGKVNRQFRQFELHGARPETLPIDLRSNDQPVGRITSTAFAAERRPAASSGARVYPARSSGTQCRRSPTTEGWQPRWLRRAELARP